MTNRLSPRLTALISLIISDVSSASEDDWSKCRKTASLVEMDCFELDKAICNAAAGLTIAPGERACRAEVEKAYDRPEKRDEESGDPMAVVTPDR